MRDGDAVGSVRRLWLNQLNVNKKKNDFVLMVIAKEKKKKKRPFSKMI